MSPILINPGAFNNAVELASLYDQYKLNWVKVTFRPKFSKDVTSNFTDPNWNAYFFSILDFDSPFSTTYTRADMQAVRNVHVSRISNTHSRVFKPTAVVQTPTLNSTGSTVTNLRRLSGWFDWSSPVDTYNLRVFTDQLTGNPVSQPELAYDIDMVLSITCKNVR